MSRTGNKSLFECYVCYSFYNNDYRKPKYLVCHHTICLDCIYKTMDSSPLGVTCPFCRKWTEIESTNVNNALRTNQDILDFMDIWLFKLTSNVESPSLGRDRDTDYNPAITSTKLKWCYNCVRLASYTCKDNTHSILNVSPAVLKFAQKAVAQGRQSQANWEEAMLKRGNFKTIATSIQSSVNRLKERVDALVDENERALIALRDRCKDVMQCVNTLDPLSSNLDMKGFVIQSEHDLKVAKEKLETWSKLDGAHVSVSFESPDRRLMDECSVLNGDLFWEDPTTDGVKKEDEDKKTGSEKDTDAFLLDARRFIGYLVASVPHTPGPQIRRNKGTRKVKRFSNPLPSVRPISLSLSSPIAHRLSAPPIKHVLSEVNEPPTIEYTSTCAWNPIESVVASASKNESVCLKLGPNFNIVAPLSFEGMPSKGSNQTPQTGGEIHRLAWNPKGTQLVTGSTDGWISFWTSSGLSLYQQKQHSGEILAMNWSPEGKLLATAGRDTLIKIWNAAGQNAVQSFTYHTSAVWDFQWQSENTFASCDFSGKVFFGDIRLVNKPQFAYTGHKDWVKCLQWDPEHFLLASCSVDTTIKIWTPLVPPFLQEYTGSNGHTKSVNAVEWSPTGPGTLYPNANRYLASCSDDQTSQILDVSKQAVVHKLETKTKPSKVTCLSFSCDGKLLATGNENGVVEIWNVHNGRIVHTFADFESSIDKIAWQKNGSKLAIAIQDKPCGIVDIKNNKQSK